MAEFRDFRGAKSEEAKSKVRKEAATIVVEINKNFSKGIPYVSWIFENCYHVSDNKFNT